MKIQKLIDVNELQFDSPFISEVEFSQFNLSEEPKWSVYPSKPVCQIDWDNVVAQEIEKIADDNPFQMLKEGEISATNSVNHKDGSYGLDTRPKVYNKFTKAGHYIVITDLNEETNWDDSVKFVSNLVILNITLSTVKFNKSIKWKG